MELVDVETNTYINSDVQINTEIPKFNICDDVLILDYKGIFWKGSKTN